MDLMSADRKSCCCSVNNCRVARALSEERSHLQIGPPNDAPQLSKGVSARGVPLGIVEEVVRQPLRLPRVTEQRAVHLVRTGLQKIIKNTTARTAHF
jgi:hypothetical protein